MVSIAVGVVSCQKDDSAKPAAGGHEGEHGTPKDWKFTLGKGDAAEGRRLFVEIECYKKDEGVKSFVDNYTGVLLSI